MTQGERDLGNAVAPLEVLEGEAIKPLATSCLEAAKRLGLDHKITARPGQLFVFGEQTRRIEHDNPYLGFKIDLSNPAKRDQFWKTVTEVQKEKK